MGIIGSLLISTVVIGATPVELETLDGARVTGELVRLNLDEVAIQVQQQQQTIPIEQLRRLRPIRKNSPAEAPSIRISIELTDGSRLQATGYQVDGARATIELVGDVTVQLPIRAVRIVRYSRPQAELDRQWQEIQQAKVAGDVLVVRRPNQILDYVVGRLDRIDPKGIRFQFDGQWMDVRQEKADGLIYFQAAAPSFPAPKCRLTTCAGDQWNLQSLVLQEQQIRIKSNNGAQLLLPITHVQSMDFGSSSSVFLSDLEPDQIQWTPLLQVKALEEELRQLFRPRRDQTLAGSKLRLEMADGQSQEYRKGLSIHSRTELVYRLSRRVSAIRGLGRPGSDDRPQQFGDAGDFR